jgi:hypothetical protein
MEKKEADKIWSDDWTHDIELIDKTVRYLNLKKTLIFLMLVPDLD